MKPIFFQTREAFCTVIPGLSMLNVLSLRENSKAILKNMSTFAQIIFEKVTIHFYNLEGSILFIASFGPSQRALQFS